MRTKKKGPGCVWTVEMKTEDDVWETACGEAHQFTVGGPRENNHRFCPYCGRPLQERKQ